MPKRHSIAEARRNLTKLIRDAESGETVELTRCGVGVAVLIGRKHYERLAAGSRDFSEAWDEFTREFELSTLEIDPDEIFRGVRDSGPRR